MSSVVYLLLRDSDPSGVVIATQDNWTGSLYALPIVELADVTTELKRPGVYILVGVSEDGDEFPSIYVGEAEEIQRRLTPAHTQLLRDDVTWNRVVIVTSKVDDLNKVHAKWLEAELVTRAKAVNRARLFNRTNPSTPALNEADVAFVQTFLDRVLTLLPLLGIDAFVAHGRTLKESDRAATNLSEYPELQLSKGGEVLARARVLADGGLTVLSGSMILISENKVAAHVVRLRKELYDFGLLAENDSETWKLLQDYDFKSPSTAADVVRGVSLSGPKEWRTADGVTLEELKRRESEI